MRKDWEVKKLDDLCTIKGRIGYRGYTKKDLVHEGEGAISLSPSNIKENKLYFNNCTYISWEKYEESPEIMVNSGDIVYCKTASIGKMALVGELPEKTTLNPQFVILKEINCFNEYLYYYMISDAFKKQAKDITGGTAVPTLSQKNLGNTKIPIPPLPEQKRIVSVIDKAFAAIDKAKANAEQNLNNAKELFESYLQRVFDNGNWEHTKLSNLTKDITDGDHMPPPKSDKGIPFITISNINKENYQIDFSKTFKVPDEYYLKIKDNRRPQKGDVLYTVTGSYGIPVIIEENKKFCFQRHIGLIRPKVELNSKLLYYWILSPQAKKQADSTATGTAQKTVSLKALRNFSFPIISIDEQTEIIKNLDELLVKYHKLQAIYQNKLNDLEELKKSILHKAFNGELK